jgi:hypothetical protein
MSEYVHVKECASRFKAKRGRVLGGGGGGWGWISDIRCLRMKWNETKRNKYPLHW